MRAHGTAYVQRMDDLEITPAVYTPSADLDMLFAELEAEPEPAVTEPAPVDADALDAQILAGLVSP